MSRPATITLLAMWTLAVFTAGAGAAVINGEPDASTVATAPPPRPSTTTQASQLPASDTIQVGGVVGSIEVVGLPSDAVGLPLTFTSAERGAGNGAEISGVLVGDDLATVVWDAGRPLELTGDGSMTFEAVGFSLVEGRLRAAVGETRAAVLPGTFRIDTPVAVGRKGLAEPLDQVTFTVGATEAPVVLFLGDIDVALPVAPVVIVGSGGLTLVGSFSSVQPNGSEVDVTRVEVARGEQFEISLAPFEGGWVIDGTVPVGSLDP